MKLQEYKFALTDLKILKDMAPDEANVHYLLGKLYKMLHDKANAIKHFTTALNLDPKVCPSSLETTYLSYLNQSNILLSRLHSSSRMRWRRWMTMTWRTKTWHRTRNAYRVSFFFSLRLLGSYLASSAFSGLVIHACTSSFSFCFSAQHHWGVLFGFSRSRHLAYGTVFFLYIMRV